MKIKKEVILWILFVFTLTNVPVGYCWGASKSKMTDSEYKKAIQFQDQYHHLYKSGSHAESGRDYKLAISYYEKGLDLVRGLGPEVIFRSKLRTVCEKAGDFNKALSHTEWFLEKTDRSSPLYLEDFETKTRLLKKIEEQKQWAAKQDPVVAKFKENFPKASDENQKKFLESLGGKGVWEVFKNAMVAEHGKNYAQALSIYENLIPRKSEIEKEMGVTGWVMLYPAIQRNSEALSLTEKEKAALAWIKTNLLAENAPYKEAKAKLLPEVVAHIKDRIKIYQL